MKKLLTALVMLFAASAGQMAASPGVISAIASPSGPIGVGDTFLVTLEIDGYTDPIEIDGYNFDVMFDSALFAFEAGSGAINDAPGADQNWLRYPPQDGVGAGAVPLSDLSSAGVGTVGVSVADMRVNSTRGTTNVSGFLFSFKLRAIATGTGSITPMPEADSAVLFDTNLRPASVPNFRADTMTVTGAPPTIVCPPTLVIWTCSNSTPVNYLPPTASSQCAGAVNVTCVPPPGSLFPVGNNLVTCTVRDNCGGSNSCTFIVRVVPDSEPPRVFCPSNIVLWTCKTEESVVFNVTASDDCDTNVDLVCVPPSGSSFAAGTTTTVVCTARDDCGKTSTCTFTVRVIQDTLPPRLVCPSNIVIITPSNSAPAAYTVTATDDCDTNVTIVCDPPPGTLLPVGVHVVTCRATDDCDHTDTCQFQIRIIRGVEIDTYPFTLGKFRLRNSAGAMEEIVMAGPAQHTVLIGPNGESGDTDGDGLDQVSARMTELMLMGTSAALGPIRLSLDPNPSRPSMGQIEEQANNTPSILDVSPFAPTGMANSFFDVWFDIELGGQMYHLAAPLPLHATISHKPPAPGEAFMSPQSMPPIDVLDANNNPTGYQIVAGMHTPELNKEIDPFPCTLGEVALQLPDGGTEVVSLRGPARVVAWIQPDGRAADTDGDGLDQVPIELVELNLTGMSSIGPVEFQLSGMRRSVGEMEETANNTAGFFDIDPFLPTGMADSFFDVWFELRLVAGVPGQALHNMQPLRLRSLIQHKPPGPGETYLSPAGLVVDLFDANNNPTGLRITRASNTPVPTNCVRIACPSNIVVWTCSPNGRQVDYSVFATNDCCGPVFLNCTPPPNSNFPVGSTTVTCTASNAGDIARCAFTVTVIRDTEPPRLVCPSNILIRTTSPNGTNVSFTIDVTDDCDTNVTLICVPPSGSVFPVGNTVVTCTAIDDCGNSNRCTFVVRVRRTPTTPALVADYIRTEVLGGSFGGVTLWMPPMALDMTHVARDLDPQMPDMRFPFPMSWLVMIDDQPEANFGHRCRWLFVDDDLTMHTPPVEKQFPPTVWGEGGSGPQVPFLCAGLTPTACPSLGPLVLTNIIRYPTGKGCLHAVLVSGGINAGANYNRYRQNLQSMYQILRACGFQKSAISVYYADGSPLDLDNLDGDSNHATGSEVNGAATEANIRGRIQGLCANLNPNRDVLLVYTSNHGADNAGLCLWDFNNNGSLQASELYSPAEFSNDTTNCRVCRLFAIFDQCYSGEFTPIATDGNHPRTAIYAAATAFEPSWGREYMMYWEMIDPATTDMNDMHASVTASMALVGHATTFAQSAAGIGDVPLCRCWTLIIPGLALDKLVLSFPSEDGIIYDIECTETLERPDWRVVQSYSGTGGVIEHNEPIGTGNRFYRIRER